MSRRWLLFIAAWVLYASFMQPPLWSLAVCVALLLAATVVELRRGARVDSFGERVERAKRRGRP